MKNERIGTYSFAENLDYRCDPWIGYNLKKINSRNGALTTNEIGLRAYSLSKISTLKDRSWSLCLGGSFVFGAYISSDKKTIPAVLTEITGHEYINAGCAGHVIKQHLALYYSRFIALKTKPKKIIIIAGYNDFMAHNSYGRKYGELILKMDSIANIAYTNKLTINPFKAFIYYLSQYKKVFKILKLKIMRNKSISSTPTSALTIDEMKSYISELTKEIDTFYQVCNALKIDFKFILQPHILSGSKVLNDNEKELFENGYGAHLNKDTANDIKRFYNIIRESMNHLNYFYDSSNVYDDETSDIFLDPAHVNDKGASLYCKKYLIKLD